MVSIKHATTTATIGETQWNEDHSVPLATQAEAEAGTVTNKLVTPQRVAQAIAALGGNVVGPASATDNAIARFNTTTGKLLQNSAATVSDDGIIRSATNSGANAVSVPLVNWLMQTADYTLTSTTAEQKAFNTTTNGRLTLPTGVYYYECWLYVTGLSATSGNLGFSPLGGGTAVVDRGGYSSYGTDNTVPTSPITLSGRSGAAVNAPGPVVEATVGTGMQVRISGMFRVTTAGTIIPSVTLSTAAAAAVKAGSWFRIDKLGESSETSVGAWS